MNSYSVRYKLPNQFFFRTIKDLVQDGYLDENKNIRYFRYTLLANTHIWLGLTRKAYLRILRTSIEYLTLMRNSTINQTC